MPVTLLSLYIPVLPSLFLGNASAASLGNAVKKSSSDLGNFLVSGVSFWSSQLCTRDDYRMSLSHCHTYRVRLIRTFVHLNALTSPASRTAAAAVARGEP